MICRCPFDSEIRPAPDIKRGEFRNRDTGRRRYLRPMKNNSLVLSGMQPTHTLNLGNYLGALKNWVRLQDQMPCLFCVVDMHALTQEVGYGHAAELTQQTREVAAAYIAGGVDPARSPIFNQSQVAEHAELDWVFN